MKLGIYPDLSLSKAREKAKDTFAHERLKSAETISIRFENALETYYRVRAAERRAITSRDCERILNKHFRAVLAK